MNKHRLKQWIGNTAGSCLLKYFMQGRVVIFTLHRVLSESDYAKCHFERSIVVTDTGLSLFIEHLKRHFEIIPLSRLQNSEQDASLFEGRPKAILTFDDGWRDNYDLALPILEAHNVPATVFLSTDYIDSTLGFWWHNLGELLTKPTLTEDQKEAIHQVINNSLGPLNAAMDYFTDVDRFIRFVKYHHYEKAHDLAAKLAEVTETKFNSHGLSWDQCHEMSAKGIEFGSHTLSHPRLSLLSESELHTELANSKHILQDKSINYIDAICYPYGDYNQSTLTISQEYYSLGLTGDTGLVNAKHFKPYLLPRINVFELLTRDNSWLNYRLLWAALKSR